MTTKVVAFPQPKLAEIVDRRLTELSGDTSLSEIARQMGLATPNYISMIRLGKAKMSLNRVEDFAKHLRLDERMLFRAALQQYYDDDVLRLMELTFNDRMTDTEAKILEIARANMDIQQPMSKDTRDAIAEAFKTNKPAGS